MIEEVERILKRHLETCTTAQLQEFRKHCTKPYLAPLVRYGKLEQVVVVARKKNEVIYWEDVEEGFNVSAVLSDGTIREHTAIKPLSALR
jgi:hypothetical protein